MNDSRDGHKCEHEGCASLDTAEYHWPGEVNGRTTIWLCADHAVETGFCLWCGHFGAGDEEYDHSPARGFHRDCWDEARFETGEIDDQDNQDVWDNWEGEP